jgi:hypothetical protein
VEECVQVARRSRLVLEGQFASDAALDQESRGGVLLPHALQRAEERHRRDALAHPPHTQAACLGIGGDQSTELLLSLRLTPRWRSGVHRVGTVVGSKSSSCMSSA